MRKTPITAMEPVRLALKSSGDVRLEARKKEVHHGHEPSLGNDTGNL